MIFIGFIIFFKKNSKTINVNRTYLSLINLIISGIKALSNNNIKTITNIDERKKSAFLLVSAVDFIIKYNDKNDVIYSKKKKNDLQIGK